MPSAIPIVDLPPRQQPLSETVGDPSVPKIAPLQPKTGRHSNCVNEEADEARVSHDGPILDQAIRRVFAAPLALVASHSSLDPILLVQPLARVLFPPICAPCAFSWRSQAPSPKEAEIYWPEASQGNPAPDAVLRKPTLLAGGDAVLPLPP